VTVSEPLVPFVAVGTDIVVDPDPATVAELNEAVKPDEEVMLKLTGPLNPFKPVILML
jgi:hypothetical protein